MSRLIKKISFLVIVFFCLIPYQYGNAEETAQILDAQIIISDGSDPTVIRDQSFTSKLNLTGNTEIEIHSSVEIGAIYLIWDTPTPGWSFISNGKTSVHGENGFLHEYVPLEQASTSITLRIPESGAILCDLIVLSPGTPPANIQVWEPPCQKADLLLLSTHADDEHLFFGGTMPYYAGEKGFRVQLVYFCSHAANEPYREHEKLNGLWLTGVRNYPIMGDFPDEYSTSLETALTQYNYDEAVAFVTTQLRRFQPLVVLGQDLNGEYGHGAHQLTAKALTDAIQLSNRSDYHPDSIKQYGLWDVPKTYLHLYPENRIQMNWNIPLERFGGQTALQMADAGYKTHASQQWCWFYVSDSYEYSCAEFGLFRSLVGPDSIGGDFMENITPYDQQASEKKKPTNTSTDTEIPENTKHNTISSTPPKQTQQLKITTDTPNSKEEATIPSSSKISSQNNQDLLSILSKHFSQHFFTILIVLVLLTIIVIIITISKRHK